MYNNRRSLFVRVFAFFLVLAAAGCLLIPTAQAAPAATYTVTHTGDSGGGSLRDAVASANSNPGADVITFDVALAGQTITLTGGEIIIDDSVSIDASALADPVTIDGNNNGRIFYMTAGTVSLTRLRFINGESNDGDPGDWDGDGGAIHVRGSATLNVTESEFANNQSEYNGGAIYIYWSAAATIVDSAFTSNSTQYAGGAIRTSTDQPVSISGSTFVGNTANEGGAIWASGNVPEIVTNNTFSSNVGDRTVYLYETLYLTNNTFMGDDGVFIRNANAVLHMRNNIIGSCANGSGGSIGTNSNNWIVNGDCSPAYSGDPKLGELADNGGPTQTAALLPGSGAIDSGDCTSGPATDQRGVARPQDTTCDLGAYEGGALQCGVSAGASYTFPNQSGVSIYVESETDLDCLYVDEIAVNHPNATGATDGQHLQTGKYWQIGGLQADGATAATTFNVDLTLPYATADVNTRACQWLEGAGPGFGWNCFDGGMGTTYVTNVSVTREDVTSFSQWAVGDDVGPTAVTLQSSQAGGRFGGAAVFATFLSLFALTGAIILLRKKRAG